MAEMPSRPIVAREPEGEYSTIRLPDGTIETILFRPDGTSNHVRRTHQGITEIQRQHIREIRAHLELEESE